MTTITLALFPVPLSTLEKPFQCEQSQKTGLMTPLLLEVKDALLHNIKLCLEKWMKYKVGNVMNHLILTCDEMKKRGRKGTLW